MKVSFFHDHPFVVYQNTYYTPGGFTRALWKRYLHSFEELVVVTRYKKAYEITESKLALSSCDQVSFEPIHNYRKESDLIFKYRKIRDQIKEVLKKTDCAIIRLPSVIGLIACQEAISMKKPWVAEVVGCAWDSYWNHGTITGKIAAPVMYLLNR